MVKKKRKKEGECYNFNKTKETCESPGQDTFSKSQLTTVLLNLTFINPSYLFSVGDVAR